MEEGWQEEAAVLCTYGRWAASCVCGSLWYLGIPWRWATVEEVTWREMLIVQCTCYWNMHELLHFCRNYWSTLSVNSGRGDIVHVHYLNDSCLKAVGLVTWCEFQIYRFIMLLSVCLETFLWLQKCCWFGTLLEHHIHLFTSNHEWMWRNKVDTFLLIWCIFTLSPS